MSDQANLLRMLEPSVRPTGAPAPHVQPRTPVERGAFADLLTQVRRADEAAELARPLKFSAHAQQRLEQAGLALSAQQKAALSQAADRAEAKGAKDALMLMDSVGMIVNVPSRTVVTVFDDGRLKDGVVTNIDSAVIVREQGQAPTGDAEHRLRL